MECVVDKFTANENLDFASTLEAQKLNEFRNFKLNLLVKAEITKISKKTSNPNWVSEKLNLYIGILAITISPLLPFYSFNNIDF